ncbi:hypothetical protein [Sutcliffiella rhizosphaerae]|uniref:Lipoprotein n=1 Tax=Sutcliffiella rhizosphaerae TaxID=2880967 RepID=A0ABM8YNE1_9BACI|nr:hypothetical protein [Sutcliffiella rhizosphaerae]CAG9621503.1 hypothetical protein BACCIP111883_02276 [Sutcliffiella rhizosphaerae]
MRLFINCMILTVLISACSSLEKKEVFPEVMPDDFSFILKYGFEARDILNTIDHTYTKNMVLDEDITIDLELSNEEIEAIYMKIKEIDLLASADKASDVSCVDPYERNEITLTINGEVYERKWITSKCDKRADDKLKEFTDFISYDIIRGKEEVKQLPATRGGYD